MTQGKKQDGGAAVGIHAHDTYKLGRRPPKGAPALKLADILTGVTPEHPVAADHFGSNQFGLYGNDQYGDCGPTSVANLLRLVTAALAGAEIQPNQRDVFVLYQQSGNPDFNPDSPVPGGPGDNGVDMQTMLEAVLTHGIGDGQGGVIKPIAFAKVDHTRDAELDAAASIFGGVLWGLDLEVAQQDQTNATPPKWDYSQSAEWGGHAVVDGKYDESTGDAEVISWQLDVQTTAALRKNQLQEAWVVIWQYNLDHPAFQQGVDLAKLEQAYQDLTGQPLPVPPPGPAPVPPAPGPAPVPPAPGPGPSGDDDALLWQSVKTWTREEHFGKSRHVAHALRQWAQAKGLS